MEKRFYIADFGPYGNGDAVSLHISKRGCVLAEYTKDPELMTEDEAYALLELVKSRPFDYSFGKAHEIINEYIKPENLEVEEFDFE